jgi:hypothetical protein
MRNEREYLIHELLAKKTEGPRKAPDCPDITDLMEVVLDQARSEVVTRVNQHSDQCRDCQHLLAVYRATLAEEEAEEESPEGTLLEQVARELAGPAASPPPAG